MTGADPVTIIFFEQAMGCETCAPTRRVLEQLAGANGQIALETLNLMLDRDRATVYGIDRVPATIVAASGRDRIRFYGAPLGNELPTLLAAIRMTATGDAGLSEPQRAQLRDLAGPVAIQVFFTPSCAFCPRMIAIACQLAVESRWVTATAIDATDYPDLVHRFNVNGVPKTVLNDRVEILGAIAEDDLIRQVVAIGAPTPARP